MNRWICKFLFSKSYREFAVADGAGHRDEFVNYDLHHLPDVGRRRRSVDTEEASVRVGVIVCGRAVQPMVPEKHFKRMLKRVERRWSEVWWIVFLSTCSRRSCTVWCTFPSPDLRRWNCLRLPSSCSIHTSLWSLGPDGNNLRVLQRREIVPADRWDLHRQERCIPPVVYLFFFLYWRCFKSKLSDSDYGHFSITNINPPVYWAIDLSTKFDDGLSGRTRSLLLGSQIGFSVTKNLSNHILVMVNAS